MKRIIDSTPWFAAEHAFVVAATTQDVSKLFLKTQLRVRHEMLWIIRPRTLLHEIVG